MIDMLQKIFRHKLARDERAIDFEFSIPHFGTWGVAYPLGIFWIQLALYLAFVSLITATMGLVTWLLVVKQRGTFSAYLATYGLLIPVAIGAPIALIRTLDVRNAILMISVGGPFSLAVFRFLEACHGTSPTYVEESVQHFLLYHVTPVPFTFHPKTMQVIPISRQELLSKAYKVMTCIIHVTVFLNLFLSTSFEPFPRRPHRTIADYFYWGNLTHNYCLAYLTSIYLEAGTLVCGLGISALSGLGTMVFNDHPLTKSTSVSEFWGRRWNIVVGGLLRRSIFKPLVSYGFSKPVSIFATFFASGMLHEYVLAIVSLRAGNNGRPVHGTMFEPRYLLQIAFFLWNAILLIAENAAENQKSTTITAATKRLPRPVKTLLVLLSAVPFAHWFMDEYIRTGVYADFAVGNFRIIKL